MDLHSRAAARSRPVRIADARDERISGADHVAIWLQIALADRPINMSYFLGELAEPDFRLENCREAAVLTVAHEPGYRAHWYCSFSPLAHDHFAPLRLLKRLAGAEFDILRYEAVRSG